MQSEPEDQQGSMPLEPQEQQPAIQIELTHEFQQNLRTLAKRYRSIRSDIEPVIGEIQKGNFLGDRLTGLGQNYIVFKIRVRNRDIQKGKSAGYRCIYQVESPTSVLLLTIYSKSDIDDISASEVCNILNDFYSNQ